MGRKVWWIGLLATFMSAGAFARDISGDWQGVLKVGGQESRLILRIKKDHGGWKATVLPIDYSGDWGLEVPATSVTLAGSHLKITIAAGGAIYRNGQYGWEFRCRNMDSGPVTTARLPPGHQEDGVAAPFAARRPLCRCGE